MKLRPILFSTAMVQALLEGTKTQTRRAIEKDSITLNHPDSQFVAFTYSDKSEKNTLAHFKRKGSGTFFAGIDSKYGGVGDILWVRESLQIVKFPGLYEAYRYANGEVRVWEHERPKYDEGATVKIDWSKVKKTPSIHVPAKYCRLFLQIKSVRVERLQDITEADSLAEGVGRIQVTRANSDGDTELRYQDYMQRHGGDINHPLHRWNHTAKTSYQGLWSKINGPESWATNPFVWVVEFERIEKPDHAH